MSFFSPCTCLIFFLFFFNDPATTEIYTLSLHDALPISAICHHVELDPISGIQFNLNRAAAERSIWPRSEEHTSELQSHSDLVCRLLLEKKKKSKIYKT